VAPLAAALKKAGTPDAAAVAVDLEARKITPEEFNEKLQAVVKQGKSPALNVEVIKLANTNSPDSVLLQMLKIYVKPLLAGILAAGIISAVMGSDCHQILALSTMFSKDIFDYYGGGRRFGEKGTVLCGRLFILLANATAYCIALFRPQIFDLAVSWAFSGFAALAPVMVAALFWKRSNKWGALAAAILVAVGVVGTGILEHAYAPYVAHAPPFVPYTIWGIGSHAILTLSAPAGKLFVCGFMPVVPMVLGSALCVILFSLLTPAPSAATLERYFPHAEREFAPAT
jgi:Na+/proline symporter